MTIKDVKRDVAAIRRKAEVDYDAAHGDEDTLLESVLRTIADGKSRNPATLAAEALKVKEIDYARYTA